MSTSVRLYGDKDKAKAIAHAHVARMLADFRLFNNFQNEINGEPLQQNQRRHLLYDGDALIGEIRMRTCFGVEVVDVLAVPPGQPRRPAPLPIPTNPPPEFYVPEFATSEPEPQGFELPIIRREEESEMKRKKEDLALPQTRICPVFLGRLPSNDGFSGYFVFLDGFISNNWIFIPKEHDTDEIAADFSARPWFPVNGYYNSIGHDGSLNQRKITSLHFYPEYRKPVRYVDHGDLTISEVRTTRLQVEGVDLSGISFGSFYYHVEDTTVHESEWMWILDYATSILNDEIPGGGLYGAVWSTSEWLGMVGTSSFLWNNELGTAGPMTTEYRFHNLTGAEVPGGGLESTVVTPTYFNFNSYGSDSSQFGYLKGTDVYLFWRMSQATGFEGSFWVTEQKYALISPLCNGGIQEITLEDLTIASAVVEIDGEEVTVYPDSNHCDWALVDLEDLVIEL